MSDSSTRSLTIHATPKQIEEVITDFGAYPDWVDAVTEAVIEESYTSGPHTGRPEVVRFTLAAGLISDVYALRYQYETDEAGVLRVLAWDLVSSKTQRAQRGSYTLEPAEDATEVTYALTIELKLPMLGILKRRAEALIMDTALNQLAKRVEGR